jgi:hypothetical protein
MTAVEAALAYAGRGWPVILLYGVGPRGCHCAKGATCPTPGKHPLSDRWQERATTDAAQIRRMFHHRADANVGLVTGSTSGFFAFDVDPRHGGDATLAQLEREHGALPDTPCVLTGGGGRQLYFQHPGFAVPNSVGVLGPGIDVRGDNGLVVAPPSRHRSGRFYAWEVTAHPDEVALAPAPAWLLARLRERGTDRRPSEAAGLQWQDLDLAHARLHVQRSRHLYEDGAPKTAAAERWVELFPETVRVLRALQPLHVIPAQPVFTTTAGQPIEPKAFASRYWYRCLRALGLRVRGLYATKDTFVTTALQVGVKVAWLEAQTGVAYATLKRHYGKWITPEGQSELERFAPLAPTLFSREEGDDIVPRRRGKRDNPRQAPETASKSKCEEGDLNPMAARATPGFFGG